eukprot:SAG11_NODE_57_length_19200_cov_18.288417_13_plen_65_part_00
MAVAPVVLERKFCRLRMEILSFETILSQTSTIAGINASRQCFTMHVNVPPAYGVNGAVSEFKKM